MGEKSEISAQMCQALPWLPYRSYFLLALFFVCHKKNHDEEVRDLAYRKKINIIYILIHWSWDFIYFYVCGEFVNTRVYLWKVHLSFYTNIMLYIHTHVTHPFACSNYNIKITYTYIYTKHFNVNFNFTDF